MTHRPPHFSSEGSLVTTGNAGMARQIRVQYRLAEQETWLLHATFANRDAAEACCQELSEDGMNARLIDYSICPVAN